MLCFSHIVLEELAFFEILIFIFITGLLGKYANGWKGTHSRLCRIFSVGRDTSSLSSFLNTNIVVFNSLKMLVYIAADKYSLVLSM